MDVGIAPRLFYFDIEKIAIKGSDPNAARLRIHQFKADIAAADLEFSAATELNEKLRRMLVIASKRHRRANINVLKEAIDALNGKAGLDEWVE